LPLFIAAAARGQTVAASPGSCLDAQIEFDTGTLQKIVGHPAWVLENADVFWEQEKAQHYTRLWAEGVDWDISYDDWREQVASLVGLTDAERQRNTLLRMTDRIVTVRGEFLRQAVPHICSFLPEASILDISIHFTAFIPARSFLREGIVINVNAPYWKNNADNILNNLVHEVFHVGYARERDNRIETALENEQVYDMLDALQNEGTATYVGYRALPNFPAPDDRDYPMLDDPNDRTRLLSGLNELFAHVGVSSPEEMRQQSWDFGVMQRAYYVVGAHMARTIDSRLGRDALIQTIQGGPMSFVQRYNSLVPEQEQLRVGSGLTP
jgi:hypothetical protein